MLGHLIRAILPRRLTWAALSGAALLSSACNPSLNWREVRFESVPGRVLLPCKPDRAERQVTLGDAKATLRMKGCEAQDLQFTWSQLDLPLGPLPTQVVRVWQQASLVALGADPAMTSQVRALTLAGARMDVPPAQLAVAVPLGPQAHFFWWLHAGQAHQLAVYANRNAVPAAVVQVLQEGIQLP
jgi:hypothetical protein